MRKTLILALLYIGLVATSDLSGYNPRGWHPNGPRFTPNNNRLHAYYDIPGLQGCGPAPNTATTERDPLFVTGTTTIRPRTTVSTTVKTTTTSRSREPTTALNEQSEDEFDTNPALANANSFAFNRPINIYKGVLV